VYEKLRPSYQRRKPVAAAEGMAMGFKTSIWKVSEAEPISHE
jgi:hypothetical protein